MIEIKQVPDGNILVKSSVSDFCASMGYNEIRLNTIFQNSPLVLLP
jgi:hypothetical protein